MSQITEFRIKNVRCFKGEQTLRIRPLTFLVGENSTGKTTLLSCIHALRGCGPLDLSHFSRQSLWRSGIGIDFNQSPYNMGAFKDIVRNKGAANTEFDLGFKVKNGKDEIDASLTFYARRDGSEPEIKCHKSQNEHGSLTVLSDKRALSKGVKKVNLPYSDDKSILHVDETRKHFYLLFKDLSDLEHFEDFAHFFLYSSSKPRMIQGMSSEARKSLSSLSKILTSLPDFPYVDSMAPVRSQPQRTYDPIEERESPDGTEMPMFLANLKWSGKTDWTRLRDKLVSFGKASGLFSDIDIRHFEDISDPFQIQIKVRGGPIANLMDTGYGVSQILPILTRLFSEVDRGYFLLQQPEVHLHPKSQAAFTSLLVEMVKEKPIRHLPFFSNMSSSDTTNFILETHSDYMIDRARIEIMEGNISPDDVSLIYLEPQGDCVQAHNITFDKEGNLSGAPDGYREFFLKETNRLLGFED